MCATSSSGSTRPRGGFDLAQSRHASTELDAQASEPDFWSDQRAAQKVLREAEGLRDEIGTWRALDQARRRPARAGRAGASRQRRYRHDRRARLRGTARRGRVRPLRTSLLFSGEYDEDDAILTDHRRRRRDRGDRLGRDAAADVPALGAAPPLLDRDPRPARGRGGRPEERHRGHRRPLTRTATCAPSAASIASCASAPTTRRSGATRRSRWSRCCPRSRTTPRSARSRRTS